MHVTEQRTARDLSNAQHVLYMCSRVGGLRSTALVADCVGRLLITSQFSE